MPDIHSLLSSRARQLRPSPIRKLVPLMRRPGVISFGGGYPNPSTFAFEHIDLTFRTGQHWALQNEDLVLASQYGPTTGAPALVDELLRWHEAKDGVHLDPENLLVLNGSQEGLHILAYLLLNSADAVAMSEPAYPGALLAFRAFDASFLTYPVDQHGTIVDELASSLQSLRKRGEPLPKFIYEVPNGHNPAGVDMSLERRKQLLAVAAEFDLLIVEDDPYELLNLDNHPRLPSLQSLDTDNRVLRLDSFSKIFAPGLRIGYATGDTELVRLFQLYKQTSNLHTSSMDQSMLAGFLASQSPNTFMQYIQDNCRVYRTNRDAMVTAAHKWLGEHVSFSIPPSGMFLWMKLADNMDTDRMIETDGERLGVLLVPGNAFSVHQDMHRYMRASFSMVSEELIDEGMRRVAEMIHLEIERNA